MSSDFCHCPGPVYAAISRRDHFTEYVQVFSLTHNFCLLFCSVSLFTAVQSVLDVGVQVETGIFRVHASRYSTQLFSVVIDVLDLTMWAKMALIS